MKEDGVYDITQNETNGYGYQENKYQFDWLCTPSVNTELLNGKISLGLSATFSVSNYSTNVVAEQILALDNKLKKASTGYSLNQINTTFATFNNLNFNATFDQISKVLKTVKVDYKMEMAWYDAYYDANQYLLKALKDKGSQLKTMYNQVVAEMSFAKDITFGLGFIVRNYFGDQENAVYNQVNPNILNQMSKDQITSFRTAAGKGFETINSAESATKAWWAKRVDYWNCGWALQFKYKIPVDWLQFPILFVNLGLGWDPFDDDGSTTQNWYKDKDSNHADSWKKNNSDWTSERSVFTVGLVWDF
jgi:hypothetical protein